MTSYWQFKFEPIDLFCSLLQGQEAVIFEDAPSAFQKVSSIGSAWLDSRSSFFGLSVVLYLSTIDPRTASTAHFSSLRAMALSQEFVFY